MASTAWHERLLPPASHSLIRRFKVTLSVLATITVIGLYTAHLSATAFQSLVGRAGVDLDSLHAGRHWVIVLATFVQASQGIQWHMMLLVVTPLGVLEYVAGSDPSLVTFLVGDWITSILTVCTLWAMSGIGIEKATRLLHTPGIGSSAAALAAAGAACVLIAGRWRKKVLALLIGISVASISFQTLDNAVAHLDGLIVGAMFGAFVWRPCLHGKPSLLREPQRTLRCMEE
ncbi:MAG: hypothetical protein ACJ789_05415 [Thermomicrobiales bacterium]